MKTASWFTALPDDHIRIGISRGALRRMTAGYRLYKTLAPGPWFNSVGIDEYYSRYRTEILGPLHPHKVRDDLDRLAAGRIPVLLCYERPGGADWCHRAMATEWLAEALGAAIPEFGYETLSQGEHPLMPPQLRRDIALADIPDVTPYVGRCATIDGEVHIVIGSDPKKPGMAIVAASRPGELAFTDRARQFSTGIDTLRRHFAEV